MQYAAVEKAKRINWRKDMTGGAGGLVKIALVGAVRYGYKGAKFEQNKHYLVKADRAKLLLRLTSDSGLFIFKVVGKDHTPQRVIPVAAPVREIPVVDTTKSSEDQFQDVLDAEVDGADVVGDPADDVETVDVSGKGDATVIVSGDEEGVEV